MNFWASTCTDEKVYHFGYYANESSTSNERTNDASNKSGLTQRQVADELGITSEMVIRMEKGKSACKTDHIFYYTSYFKY